MLPTVAGLVSVTWWQGKFYELLIGVACLPARVITTVSLSERVVSDKRTNA